uniref:Uncharacterized protein n=1 Tax=Caenorhabditis japonica TaxID=281687 RepID=A0A8R1IPH6_CAEJA
MEIWRAETARQKEVVRVISTSRIAHLGGAHLQPQRKSWRERGREREEETGGWMDGRMERLAIDLEERRRRRKKEEEEEGGGGRRATAKKKKKKKKKTTTAQPPHATTRGQHRHTH